MARQTASVGVDVDALKHYFQIHGLDGSQASDKAWTVGVPRFLDLFAELGIFGSFYCVASDLDQDYARDIVRKIVRAGHEIGNHTLDHHYGLTRLSATEIYHQISEARVRLEAVAKEPVVGFRAPGYHINPTVLRAVKASGHLYDSSVFPCVPYYTAKAGIMAAMRIQGRRSRSIIGSPRVLFAPNRPYLAAMSAPYQMDELSGFPEYPITVTGGIPLIGTAFTALGFRLSQLAMAASLQFKGHLTLEFHAADLLSIKEDQLDSTLSIQPDLNVSWLKKRDIYAHVLALVKTKASFVRLDRLGVQE